MKREEGGWGSASSPSFHQLGISAEMDEALQTIGLKKATPVLVNALSLSLSLSLHLSICLPIQSVMFIVLAQELAIPYLMRVHTAAATTIGAPTGTGKTLSYLIPLIEKLREVRHISLI